MNRPTRPRGFLSTAAVVLLGALCLHTLSVEGSRPLRVAADPTPVAVVDIFRVLNQIDELAEWEVRLNALGSSFRREATAREDTYKKLQSESEQAATPEERQRILEEMQLLRLRYEQWEILKQQELDRERTLMWRSIFRNLRRESQRVAETEGYEMVMVDDSVHDLQPNPQLDGPSWAQVRDQIINRRILFAANTIDITDQVIVRMNNAANAAP